MKHLSRRNRLLYFHNPEQSNAPEETPIVQDIEVKVQLQAEQLESSTNKEGEKRLSKTNAESAREEAAVADTNNDLRIMDADSVRIAQLPDIETPTPVGNLGNVDKNAGRLDMLGVTGEFADQAATFKTATDRAYRVFLERPSEDTKKTLDTAVAAEKELINAHRSEWKTGDDSLKEREFMNRLATLDEALQRNPESITAKREFQEQEKSAQETREKEYEQKIVSILQNENPQYPLPQGLKTFAQNAIARLHNVQEARTSADTWQAKQTPDTQEAYWEVQKAAVTGERDQIKMGYGIWQGTPMEQIFRDRYAEITDDPQFARESQLVKDGMSEEQQLADWLDFQDKVSGREVGSTQKRMRGNDRQGRLLFSNLSDFQRQEFTRDKANGRLPTLTQSQFDKKYFNADLFRTSVDANGHFIPNRMPEPGSGPTQLAESEDTDAAGGLNNAPIVMGPMGIPMPGPGMASLAMNQTPNSITPNAPTGMPPHAPRSQLQPASQPVLDPVTVKAELLDDMNGGQLDWAALQPEEKELRTADIRQRYGVDVDANGDIVVPPDTKEGREQMSKNRFEGRMTQQKTAAEQKIAAKSWDKLSAADREKLTADLQIEHGVSVDEQGKVTMPSGKLEELMNRLGGYLTKFFMTFAAFGKAFEKKNAPQSAPTSLLDLKQATDSVKGSPDGPKKYKDALKIERDALTGIDTVKRTPEQQERLTYLENEMKRLDLELIRTAAEESFGKDTTKAGAEGVVDALNAEIAHLKGYPEGLALKRKFGVAGDESELWKKLEEKQRQYTEKMNSL